MTDKRDLRKKLWKLHGELIDYFIDQLSDPQSLKGSSLDAIRAFLKDNAVTRNESKKAGSIDALSELLSEWSEEFDPEEQTDDDDNQDAEDDMKQDFKFAQ